MSRSRSASPRRSRSVSLRRSRSASLRRSRSGSIKGSRYFQYVAPFFPPYLYLDCPVLMTAVEYLMDLIEMECFRRYLGKKSSLSTCPNEEKPAKDFKGVTEVMEGGLRHKSSNHSSEHSGKHVENFWSQLIC